MKPIASNLVAFGIPALAIAVASLIGVATWKTSPRPLRTRNVLMFGAGAGGWLALSALLAVCGFYADFDALPPHMLLLLGPATVLPAAFALSPIGKRMASALPLSALVGLHAFRFPLELLMHHAMRDGVMPRQMSYSGWNFDIVTGALAVVVAALAARGRAPRLLVVAFNAVGCVTLFAVLAIAVASFPRFAAFGSAPRDLNTWIAYFPYVWLPAGLVPSAIAGHVLLTRRLLEDARKGVRALADSRTLSDAPGREPRGGAEIARRT